MRKLIAVSTVLAFLLFPFGPGALAQGMKWRGSGGWGPGSAYGRMYDPKTVETVTGEVVKVDRITPMRGMSGGVHLVVKTDKGDVSVHAPASPVTPTRRRCSTPTAPRCAATASVACRPSNTPRARSRHELARVDHTFARRRHHGDVPQAARRPRLTAALVGGAVCAALVAVPLPYQRVVAHEVTLGLGGAHLDQAQVGRIAGELAARSTPTAACA